MKGTGEAYGATAEALGRYGAVLATQDAEAETETEQRPTKQENAAEQHWRRRAREAGDARRRGATAEAEAARRRDG